MIGGCGAADRPRFTAVRLVLTLPWNSRATFLRVWRAECVDGVRYGLGCDDQNSGIERAPSRVVATFHLQALLTISQREL